MFTLLVVEPVTAQNCTTRSCWRSSILLAIRLVMLSDDLIALVRMMEFESAGGVFMGIVAHRGSWEAVNALYASQCRNVDGLSYVEAKGYNQLAERTARAHRIEVGGDSPDDDEGSVWVDVKQTVPLEFLCPT